MRIGAVVERVLRGGQLDRLAMMLSGLCLVHCVATVVLLGLLSSMATWLGTPIIHEVGLGLAIAFGAVALVGGAITHGVMLPTLVGALGLMTMTTALLIPHGGGEAALTMIGVSLLAVAHLMNRRAHGG
jgi:hypothetical protein